MTSNLLPAMGTSVNNNNNNSINSNNSNSINSTPPASLPVAVPQTPPVAAPNTGQTPVTHPGLGDHNSTATIGRTNSPAVATSAVLSAAAPTLNGTSNTMPSMMHGTNGTIPPPYHRTAYPGYPLYTPYSNLHHSPYLPPAVPSPSVSPRTQDSRTNRESPLILSAKPVRPITPNTLNNSIPSVAHTQSPLSMIPGVMPPMLSSSSVGSLNNRDPQQHSQISLPLSSQHSSSSTITRPHTPRGHSPTRERDSYR